MATDHYRWKQILRHPRFCNSSNRLEVIKSLPNLKQLDGEMVNDKERRDAGHSVSSESEDGSSDDGGIGEDEDEATNSESYHKTLEGKTTMCSWYNHIV